MTTPHPGVATAQSIIQVDRFDSAISSDVFFSSVESTLDQIRYLPKVAGVGFSGSIELRSSDGP